MPVAPHPASTGRRLRSGAAVALAVVMGCSGGPAHHPAESGTSSTMATAPTTAVTVAPTTPASVPSTSAPSGAVPAGFYALSYTAVSADNFWLLGTAPCPRPVCTAIVHTTDGGRHFTAVPAPPAPLDDDRPTGSAGVVNTLRFAGPSDGYALEVGPGQHGGAWATHDGGEHWRAIELGQVVSFDISDGEAYAVVADCTDAGCGQLRLARSAASGDEWSTSVLPGLARTALASVTAHGADVWVNGDGADQQHKVLLGSTDRGATFVAGTSPCTPGLGGDVEAVSATVLWAVCPTGMMASVARSTDGGATFRYLDLLPTGGLTNGGQVAAAGAASAVVVSPDSPTMRRTTDGVTFHPGFTEPNGGGWLYAGFTTPTVGVAISSSSTTLPPSGTTSCWRTTDGGLTWEQLTV